MRHDYTIADYGVVLRPVEESDAAFIVALRTQPELAAYIGDTGDLASQRAWLQRYFERSGDYYFIVARAEDQTPIGTVAIYDTQGRQAEWGRWVLQPGSHLGVASAALIYRMAFDVLGLDTLYGRVVRENSSVVAFHDHCGLVRVGIQENAVTINGRAFDQIDFKLTRDRWPQAREKLERGMIGLSSVKRIDS